MAGHAQLKFVMTECSKTQIRLSRPTCSQVFLYVSHVLFVLYLHVFFKGPLLLLFYVPNFEKVFYHWNPVKRKFYSLEAHSASSQSTASELRLNNTLIFSVEQIRRVFSDN